MNSQGKIILATDLSENAKHAVQMGLRWAQFYNLQPIIVYCDEPVFYPGQSEKLCYVEDLESFHPHDKVCEKHTSEIKSHLAGIKSKYAVEVWQGNAVDAILETTKEHAANLIITGLTGTGILQQITVGSTALRLMELSPVSVLCVDKSLKDLPVRPLVCFDFSKSSEVAFNQAVKYSEPTAMSFDLLHIVNPLVAVEVNFMEEDINSFDEALNYLHKESQQKLNELSERHQVRTNVYVESSGSSSPGKQIIEYAAQNGNDLIFIGGHGKSEKNAIDRWLLGSTTEYVVKRAKKSVMICR